MVPGCLPLPHAPGMQGSPAPSNPHNPTSLPFLSVVCASPGWLCSPRDEALLVCVVLGPAGAPSPGDLAATDLRNQSQGPLDQGHTGF